MAFLCALPAFAQSETEFTAPDAAAPPSASDGDQAATEDEAPAAESEANTPKEAAEDSPEGEPAPDNPPSDVHPEKTPKEETPPAAATGRQPETSDPSEGKAPNDAYAPDPAPFANAEVEPAPKDGPLPKTPGAQPPPQWNDADEMIEVAAEGSIETCEALTFPLVFLPGIGSVIGSVAEWACLFPGALAVDYTQAFHGDRDSLLWQAGAALVMAKLWREVWKYAGIAAIVGLVAAGIGAGTALALVAPYYIPVAIAGLVTAGGAGFLVWKRLRAAGASGLFSLTYWLFTGEFESEAHRQEVQERAPVKYRVEGMNRAWALMATAAGAQPDRELWFYIPIFGAWGKAMARAEAVKAAMRRTGDDVLDEERIRGPEVYVAMDNVIDTFAYAEGGLMATAHVLLIGGGLLFTVGTGFAALQYQEENNFGNYAILAGTTGTIGIVVASGGLVALGLREIVKAFRPFAAPFAYGFAAPEDAALEANAE